MKERNHDMMKAEERWQTSDRRNTFFGYPYHSNFYDLPADTCQPQWLAMGNAGAFGIHSGVQRHYGYTQILQDRQQQPTQTICTGHANVSAASREQDREFLSQGVKDYWKAQETSMYKSTIKDVKALKKAYKKSKKDGRLRNQDR